MRQIEILKRVLRERGTWVVGTDLRELPTPWGSTGSQADRRLRELAEAGEVEHRINPRTRVAEYRAWKTMERELEEVSARKESRRAPLNAAFDGEPEPAPCWQHPEEENWYSFLRNPARYVCLVCHPPIEFRLGRYVSEVRTPIR